MGGVVGPGQFPVSAFYKTGGQEEHFALERSAQRRSGHARRESAVRVPDSLANAHGSAA
jgi:hypothetical protein